LAKIAENCDHNIDSRVGQFSPFGRLFTFGSFSKIAEVARVLELLFSPGKSSALVLAKMGWATFWAIFSPMHPFTLALAKQDAEKEL
jgi:hypothetical protein